MTPTPPAEGPPPITLDGAGEVIASLPYLLGFHPHDSLIAIELQDPIEASNKQALRLTVRVDLPPPAHNDTAAEMITDALRTHGAQSVALIVVTAGHGPGLPVRPLVDECEAVLTSANILLGEAWWAAATTPGARWQCYGDPDHHGTVPDFTTSRLAATAVMAGLVTHASREEMHAVLTPDPDDVLARRAAVLASLAASHRAHPSDSYRRFLDLSHAIRQAAAGFLPSSDQEIMRLVLALRDHDVRDACLMFAENELRDGAEQLWQYLVRSTPEPDRAEPASLLAAAMLMRGDTVAAGIALERGRAANPRHRLTDLLTAALNQGLTHAELGPAFSQMLTEALAEVMKSRP